ncbi:MAG: hypothetical protein WDW36_002408 [Sanguina aurantia]
MGLKQHTAPLRTGTPLPLRLLDGFSFVRADDPSQPANLIDVRDMQILALGTVLQPCDMTPERLGGSQAIAVQLGPLLDWVIEYGAAPAMWICTSKAWYKLLAPSPDYIPHFADIQRKYDLVIRTANVIYDNNEVSLLEALETVITSGDDGITSLSTYTEEDVVAEAAFMYRQLSLWADNFDLAQEDEPMLPVLASLRGLALRAGSYPEDLVVSHSGAGARQAAVAAPGGGGGGRNDDGGDEEDDEEDEEEDEDAAGGRMRKRDDGNQDASRKRKARAGDGSGGRRGSTGGPSKKTNPMPRPSVSVVVQSSGAARGFQRKSGGGGNGARASLAGYGRTAMFTLTTTEADEFPGDEAAGVESEVVEEEEEESEEESEDEEEESELVAEMLRQDPTLSQSGIEARLAQRHSDCAARAVDRRAERASAKAAALAAADSARGPPPAACSDWHMDADMVPSVLALWEMCMTFNDLLHLPPFPLRYLEAAICVGPRLLPDTPPAPAAAADAATNGTPTANVKPEAAADHTPADVRTEGQGVKSEADNGAAAEDKEPDPAAASTADPESAADLKSEPSVPRYDPASLANRDYLHSSLLMRDIHWGLLRLADSGGRPVRAIEPPELARPVMEDPKAELWPERTWHVVLAAPAELSSTEARVYTYMYHMCSATGAPRLHPRHGGYWDTVIAPRHDGISGPNVLTPLGSLNSVDDDWLTDGRDSCPALGELPQPRIGVLLGGPRKGILLDAAYAQQLLQRLLYRYQHEGGSLMVMASRRTPASMIALFRDALQNVPGLVWADHGDGVNPYPGVLGWADRLVVTPDSVNMLSEACAVGCPVATYAPAALQKRIALFHAALRDAGLLSDIEAAGASAATVGAGFVARPSLRETQAIAVELRARLANHQLQPRASARAEAD